MDLTVVVDPFEQQGQDGVDVWEDDGGSVISLQGFHEGFRHAVALRAPHWREQQG